MDELSYEVGIDPLELRKLNFSTQDENAGKQFTSKALDVCYREGAAAFGWSKRKPEPRAMRESHEFIGWGVSTGVWEAILQEAEARARLTDDGKLEVSTAASDIGNRYMDHPDADRRRCVWTFRSGGQSADGDSALPASPVEGGSWTAASNGFAVQAACECREERSVQACEARGQFAIGGCKV